MTWFFWPTVWLAIFFLVILWRFFYRFLPRLGVLDLMVVPTLVLVHLTWGAAFYRSDLLGILVIWLVIGSLWSFIALRHHQHLSFFFHRYWQATSLLGILLLVILTLAAVFLKK